MKTKNMSCRLCFKEECNGECQQSLIDLSPNDIKKVPKPVAVNPPTVYPNDGGCWFCYTNGDVLDTVFDTEFDTFVHIKCLKKAYLEGNKEAEIMAYLLPREDKKVCIAEEPLLSDGYCHYSPVDGEDYCIHHLVQHLLPYKKDWQSIAGKANLAGLVLRNWKILKKN